MCSSGFLSSAVAVVHCALSVGAARLRPRFCAILTTPSNGFRVLVGLLFVVLLGLRIPSLVQPAGADQALYAYVGGRILAGDVPYVDAWDQKPPAVHFTYALMLALWPHESVVALTDALVAAGIAVVLLVLGTRLSGTPLGGAIASLSYLLLANPAFTRLGGVRIRAQSEAFIGLSVALALLLVTRPALARAKQWQWYAGGVFIGVAGTYKYNALAYLLPVAVLALAEASRSWSRTAWLGLARSGGAILLGVLTPFMLFAVYFWAHGALDDLYHATITYNLQYSGETYAGAWHAIGYLMTFPVRHASLDSLWMLGGAGTAVLLAAGIRRPLLWAGPAWVGAACLAIAANGSRGLPQYFVQAWPALALTSGIAGAWVWMRMPGVARLALIALVVAAVPRVTTFPKLIEVTSADWSRMTGRMEREEYLARFGNPDSGDKYSALAVHRLAGLIRRSTTPDQPVFVFGFSPWAYVGSGRASASRFFWSRPVIIGFEEGRLGYGVQGLLEELRQQQPPLIALQERDWDPDGPNSADFFLSEPRLDSWLRSNYRQTGRLHNFQLWVRNAS